MTLINPKLTLTFELATPETQILTNCDIIKNSVVFNEQLLNELNASSNKITLNLSKDCTAIEKILTYQVDTQAVLMDGTTVLFTGYLSDNYTWRVNTSGEQEFQITIEDVGTKKLGKSFLLSNGPAQAYLNAAVYSGANSVVYQVCNRAGISIAANQPAITTVAQATIDKNLTCKDLLSQVLKECGYTYYFNSDGQLCLYKIDCASVSGIPVINKDSLYAVSGNAITLTKKVKQYKQVNVSFDEYETRTNAVVYKDISGQDEDHPNCNITIKPGEYYPVPLLSVASISEMLALDTTDVEVGDYVKVTGTGNFYEVLTQGTPGADYTGDYFSFSLATMSEISYVEATDIDKGKEIISIQNVVGEVEFQGSLTYEIAQRGAKNVAVVLHNTGSTDTTVTKLQAKATITDIRSKCILTAGEGSGVEGSENLFSTEAKYIHTKAYAQTYANLISQYYRYCNYTYQFYSTSNYALGTIVNVVDNLFSGLTVNLLLTARSYSDKSNIYRYTGVAISPFDLSAEIVVEDTILPDNITQGPAGPAGESPLSVAWTSKVISAASNGFVTEQQESEVQSFNTNSYTITANDSNVEYMVGDKVYPFLLGMDKVTITKENDTPVITGVETSSGDLLTDIFDSQGFSSPYTELLGELPSFSTSITLPDNSANDFYYTLLNSSATQANWEAAYWPFDINKLTVTATDGTYTSRDVLSIIKAESALSTYQYAMITSGTPSDEDWSDIRPGGWYVGCKYWMRIKNTWEDGSETYSEPWEDSSSNELMTASATFQIAASSLTYEKDLRDSSSESIIFTASSTKYISPNYSWTINGQSFTGDTVTFSFAKNAAPAVITVLCSLASTVAGTVYRGEPKTMVLSCVDVTRFNENYGIQTSNPSTGIEGDSYVKQVGDNYYPYAYVSGEWVQIENIADYPNEIAQCRDAILANGVNVKETSAVLYGYFRNLSAQYAQIDNLVTETISLQNGGVIKSDNYTEDQTGKPLTGFYMDYDGNSKFVNSTILDATVSGSFTSDPLETRDETPGSQITASWGNTAYYNDGTVYSAIADYTTPGVLTSITTGTRTYGNQTVGKVLRLTEDSQRTASKTLAQNTSITGSTTVSGTMPVNCSNTKLTATPLVKNLTNLAGSVTRTATTQYSTDGTNWSTLNSSQIINAGYGTTVQTRQVYDSSSVTLGTKENFTTNNTSDQFYSGAYGNGVFVCIGKGYNSYLWRSTDGVNWTRMSVTGNSTGYNYKVVTFGNGVFVAAGYSTNSVASGIIATSTDGANWTYNYIGGGWVSFGSNGEFRTGAATFNNVTLYSSTNGYNWSSVGSSGGSLVYPVYGNGSWKTFSNTHITYLNGQFIRTPSTSVQVSTDGSTWTTKYVFPNTSAGKTTTIRNLPVYYCGYYWLCAYSDPVYSGGRGGRIYYSSDLENWTEITSFHSETLMYGIAGDGVISFNGGRFGTAASPTYFTAHCFYGEYTDSDFTVTTTGSLAIKYDYTNYPLGANILSESAGILATKMSNINSWDTVKTTITAFNLNPTAYYKFIEFNQASFDARDYVLNSSFTVVYTKFDGSSLNLNSYSTGGYKYHLRWNGSTFYVFLNGVQLGSFTAADYFTAGSSVVFTPMAQTDAILVKDVIPKTDSTYSIGESENEFLAAYIDNIYAVNISGDLKCEYVTSSITVSDLAIYSLRNLFVGSGSHTITVGTGSYLVNGTDVASGDSVSVTGPALVSVFRYQ